jgi:hypothetical protein
MIVALASFKKFHGIDELEFMKTSTGRLMCVTQLPAGVPQIFVAKGVTKDQINALWLSHPGQDPANGDILIAGSTKMTAGFTL